MAGNDKGYKWKLEDIYASDDLWEKDFKQVERLLQEVAGCRGKVGQSAQTLLETLAANERLQMLNEKVYTYASMRQDEDNTDAAYQALKDRAAGLSAKVHAATAFIVPEILAMPVETLQSYRRQEPGLAAYSFFLDELIREKPHVLSEAEEQIIARSSEINQAPGKIFRMLNNADMTFPNIKDEQGKEVAVTHGSYQKFMFSSSRRVREDAFKALYGSYDSHKNTFAATLSSSVKKDIFLAGVRKHESALSAALFADNVPPEVYDNLIETVRSNLGLMHRYMALRKKLLGVDELHMYDVYAPLVKDVHWEIPYPEAVELVKEALAPLGEDYVNTMTEGFNSGWVDVYERKGKTSGAYSWGPYGVHPYILMNYQDNLHSVFTLAHEMGHAMHSYYSYKEQPYVNAHYSIFTAEVASTVNEALLMKHLLNTVTDKEKKLYLINHYLEQIRGTLIRQVMFAEFEKIIHQKAEDGEALTAELLSEIYHRLNVDYYGPEMVVDKEIDLEWARIPHFYNAFYVYKYATGISAATFLSQKIVEEGEPAVKRYIEFLKSGGSDYPLNLLKKAGVDMTSAQPVQDTLDLFARLLEEMENLTDNR
uniref:oligoendopeptidase F n=1 Tax=Desulforadius tongensis TaxID=1216062 RepID=UPI00195BEC53|nr:oligoendopeptidase F [Desulforadius tongensis]